MLLVTSFAARINKAFETTTETVITFVLPFIILFPLNYYADIYPLNLILATAFSFNMGWMIAPGIIAIGEQFKWRRYIKNKGIGSKTVVTKKADWLERLYGTKDEKHFVYYYKSSPENTFEIKSDEYRKLKDDFNADIVSKDPYNQEWQNVIFQAALGTTIAVFLAAGINYVGVVDLELLQEDSNRNSRRFGGFYDELRLEWGDPDDPADMEYIIETSPLRQAHNIKSPVLIMHGAQDNNVRLVHARKLAEAHIAKVLICKTRPPTAR